MCYDAYNIIPRATRSRQRPGLVPVCVSPHLFVQRRVSLPHTRVLFSPALLGHECTLSCLSLGQSGLYLALLLTRLG